MVRDSSVGSGVVPPISNSDGTLINLRYEQLTAWSVSKAGVCVSPLYSPLGSFSPLYNFI